MDDGVSGEKGEAIGHCLCNEQPVKGVAVVRVQVLGGEDVFVAKGEQGDVVLGKLIVDDGDRGRGQFAEPTGSDGDGELPKGHDGEEELMLVAREDSPGPRRDSPIL